MSEATIQRHLSIESARETASEWVWCQGWSPREGAFGRPMPEYGYAGELQYDLAGACSGELMHPDSGCKNVSKARLRPDQVEAVAQRILEARLQKYEAERPRRDKWAAAKAYFGKCNMGMVEIGDNLAHIHRSSDGAVAVIELINGQWVARPPRDGEKIHV